MPVDIFEASRRNDYDIIRNLLLDDGGVVNTLDWGGEQRLLACLLCLVAPNLICYIDDRLFSSYVIKEIRRSSWRACCDPTHLSKY